MGFGTRQIAIFIGELYFMLPFTLQVKHLILFPGIEHIKNTINKMHRKSTEILSNTFKFQVSSSPFSFFLFLVRNSQGSDQLKQLRILNSNAIELKSLLQNFLLWSSGSPHSPLAVILILHSESDSLFPFTNRSWFWYPSWHCLG